jgi:hypothetical protein
MYNNSASLLQNGYRLPFSEIKQTVHGVDYARPSSVEVEVTVEVHFSPSGPSWPVIGRNLHFTFAYNKSVPALQQTDCISFKTNQTVDAVFSFEN